MPNISFPRSIPGLTRSNFLLGLQLYPEDDARGRFLDSFQAAAWGHFLFISVSFTFQWKRDSWLLATLLPN